MIFPVFHAISGVRVRGLAAAPSPVRVMRRRFLDHAGSLIAGF